jgi:hypothetical protein
MAAAAALIAAAAVIFRGEIEEIRRRRRRRHVVVCGLGERGSRLVTGLLAAGYDVVGVERDEGARTLPELRRRHVLVVLGDAREADVLRQAGVARASHVVAMTGTDDANAEVVIRAGQLAGSRRDAPLTCLVDIRDPDLCALLRAEELAGAGRTGYRLDFFNVYEQGARMVLYDHPPFQADGAGTSHLLVIGLNALGRSLVVEAARRWRTRASSDRELVITAVDPDVDRVLSLLTTRYPHLAEVARLHPIASAATPVRPEWVGGVGRMTAPAVYVCLDDGSLALEAALQACRCPAFGATTVVAQMNRAAGLSNLLDGAGASGRLRVFDLLDRVLGAGLLLGGTYELLARTIHERYRAQRVREGADPADDPSLSPWGRLPETLKESNRSQAAHIGVKLAAISCAIVPLSDWEAQAPDFSPDEVELLAEMEHERWVAQRLQEGWRPGPRDARTRTSPYLVPWEDLGEDVRELDRQAVRATPALLSSAGYQLIRLGEPGAPDRPHPRLAEVPPAPGRPASRPIEVGDYGATWKAG